MRRMAQVDKLNFTKIRTAAPMQGVRTAHSQELKSQTTIERELKKERQVISSTVDVALNYAKTPHLCGTGRLAKVNLPGGGGVYKW